MLTKSIGNTFKNSISQVIKSVDGSRKGNRSKKLKETMFIYTHQ